MNRLTDLPTLRISPADFLNFSYRGKPYRGAAGDTVATALFANGVRVFARSIKYHRPRGLYSLDGECSNTSMEINGIPNVRSEKTLLQDGMVVKPQNVWGSPERDFLGFLDRLDWAMPAGFYYRWMHKPYRFWPFFLKQIRKMAGLGVLKPSAELAGHHDEAYPNADVCVIGGGPAGMSAALAAAEQGLRVILVESRPWLGGYFDYRAAEYTPGVPLYERAKELSRQVEESPNIRVFSHTTTIGVYSNNLITASQIGREGGGFGERYVEIRAGSLVVATGCIERPLIFENNERPGVMQIACAHRLSRTYGLLPGERAVFSVGHDLGLEAAMDLSDLGVSVLAVADVRQDGQDPRLVEGLAEKKIPFLRGWVSSNAQGSKTLKKVTLSTTEGMRHREYECDVLVASAGLTPVYGPLTLARANMEFDVHTGFYLPTQLPPKVHAAGRLLGLHDPVSVETSGRLAGLSAAADCGASVETHLKEAQKKHDGLPGPVRGSKLVMAPVKGKKSFICFDEDATIKNIYQGCDMGFDAVELSKRFTAASTGSGQGGIPGHNLPLVISQYHAESAESALPSTIRAPMFPTFMATYAGTNHDMYKRSPLHESQERAGAIFRRIGVWKRARYFSKDFSCRAEIENVRNNVGLIDVSTLGKFRLFGADALKALQRLYVGDMSKIPQGKIKYSAMCNDDGNLIDDGVIAKRGDADYYFTASTARAGATVEWFRYHSRYEGWEYHLVNLTDAFGAINMAGPNARLVLQKLTDADVSNEAFPFMGYREFTLAEAIPVRVMRLGFVGELSFEMHIPASLTQTAWDLLMEAGEEFGIRAFGLEAQSALRMEKGHVIIGQESEIRTTLHDLGLGFLWFREKPEAKTVGAVALKQTEQQEGRLKLVGIRMEDSSRCPEDGSLIVDSEIRGFVCTIRKSTALNASVGLALVESQLAKQGTRLEIFEDGSGDARRYATVVPTPFYDPEGKRLRM